eukprot:jgi/Mesvir1/10765/Mv13831-RA.1
MWHRLMANLDHSSSWQHHETHGGLQGSSMRARMTRKLTYSDDSSSDEADASAKWLARTRWCAQPLPKARSRGTRQLLQKPTARRVAPAPSTEAESDDAWPSDENEAGSSHSTPAEPKVYLVGNNFTEPTGPGKSKRMARFIVKEMTPTEQTSCRHTGMACAEDAPLGGARKRLREGSLGTCALVGLGANLLGRRRGRDIDAHDTVIRFGGAPIQGYEADVGRRTSVAYVREVPNMRKEERTEGGPKRVYVPGSDVWGSQVALPELMYVSEGLHDVGLKKHVDVDEHRGKAYWPITALSMEGGLRAVNVYHRLAGLVTMVADELKGADREGVREAIRDRMLKPTSGMKLIFTLVHSRLCTRLDLYGFSRDGTGHYFEGLSHARRDARSAMHFKHVAGLEYYVYKVAMENGILCLYD